MFMFVWRAYHSLPVICWHLSYRLFDPHLETVSLLWHRPEQIDCCRSQIQTGIEPTIELTHRNGDFSFYRNPSAILNFLKWIILTAGRLRRINVHHHVKFYHSR